MRTLPRLLRHIEEHVCLDGHSSFDPWLLAAYWDIHVMDFLDARAAAFEAGYIIKEDKWTGSWRRLRLTAKGKQFLEAQP